MWFVVTFSTWGDTQPQRNFRIKAHTLHAAKVGAEQFQGLETHTDEGLGNIIEIRLASKAELKGITPLRVFNDLLKRTQEMQSA